MSTKQAAEALEELGFSEYDAGRVARAAEAAHRAACRMDAEGLRTANATEAGRATLKLAVFFGEATDGLRENFHLLAHAKRGT